jgi:hypothetical protein
MDINKMTLEELKVLAYDQLALLEQTKNNLQVINQKINERSESKPEAKTTNGAK